MAEFEINGEQYRSSKLTAFQQFHIARRLSPLLLAAGNKGNEMASFGQAMANMKDEDGEYVLTVCLSAAERYNKDSKLWTPVWNVAAKRAMFQDLYDLGALFPVVAQVIADNLGNFLAALPTDLVGGTAQKSPT